MIIFYNVSRKLRKDFEKRLEELAQEGNWTAIRALSIALFAIGMRERYFVIPNSEIASTGGLYSSMVLVFSLFFLSLFFLSIKSFRVLVKKYVFDYDSICLPFLSTTKIQKNYDKIAMVDKEIRYSKALLDMTSSKKIKYAGWFLEESMSSNIDELGIALSFSRALKSKNINESNGLKSKIKSASVELVELYNKLKSSGVLFSEEFEAKWSASEVTK